jgi:hypothetical protein
MAEIILLCLLVLGLNWWWWHRAESVESTPRFEVFGDADTAGVAEKGVPRILWTYWHSGEPPLVVRRCLTSWQAHNPGYVVNLVTEQNLSQFVDMKEVPAAFAHTWPARQSDWLRLYLLYRYGGIWLDASIFLTGPIDWLIETQARDGSEYVGFYLERATSRADCPIIDSWCMAAPIGSRFVRNWYRELTDRAMALGDQAYLDELASRRVLDKIVQKLTDPAYLIIHVTGQVVLHDQGRYRISLTRAEDSAYFYQQRSGWKRGWFYVRLLLLKQPRRAPALVKLRGGERRKLEGYLRWRFYRNDSLAGGHLSAAGPDLPITRPPLAVRNSEPSPAASAEAGSGRHD